MKDYIKIRRKAKGKEKAHLFLHWVPRINMKDLPEENLKKEEYTWYTRIKSSTLQYAIFHHSLLPNKNSATDTLLEVLRKERMF